MEDPRTAALLHLIDAIAVCQPELIGLENVFGFESSQAFERLRHVLDRCSYHVATLRLCPTEMGWPNRRPRFYVLASRRPLRAWQPLPVYRMPLSQFMDQDSRDADCLWLDHVDATRYWTAMDRVEPSCSSASTACFAGSYGKTILHAGSYVQVGNRLRRFTPSEVARLLGFPEQFSMAGLNHRAAWKLLGNSLSIPAVRYVVSHLTGCD